MKSGWKYCQLEDVVTKGTSNISLKKIAGKDGDYPVYGAQGFVQNVAFYHQEEEYLAIIKDGAGIGRVSKHPLKSSIIGTMQYLIPKKGFNIDFIKYFLDGINFEKHKNGSTIPHIYFKDYKSEKFPKLSLPEQQRIVAILDEVFAAIEKAKANAEQNLKNAKELFESYLNGVFVNISKKAVKVKIGEICRLTRGHNPPKSQFIYEPRKGYIRFYQIRDGASDNNIVYVPDTPKLHKVDKQELLMVAYRHIGRVFRGVSGAFNVALCKLTNKNEGRLNSEYLFNIVPTNFVRGELLKKSERSLIPSMSVQHLKEIEIPLPTLQEQQTIVRQLDALRAETQKLEASYQKKINVLEELKKNILQKAFAGELKT